MGLIKIPIFKLFLPPFTISFSYLCASVRPFKYFPLLVISQKSQSCSVSDPTQNQTACFIIKSKHGRSIGRA